MRLAERLQPVANVGPGREAVRRLPGDRLPVCAVEGIELLVRNERVEAEAVRVVDVVRGRTVASLIEHGGQRPPPKVVGQPGPVTLDAVPSAGLREGVAEAAVPVEQRPSRVEGQCLDAGRAHDVATAGRMAVRASMASGAPAPPLHTYA